MARQALLPTLLPLVLAAACGEDPPPPVDMTPIVGALELPISRNNDATRPAGAAQVEIAMGELRVDGTKVIDLDPQQGRVPAAELSDHQIPKLRDRLRSPARQAAALYVNATVAYATLSEVLGTLHASGIREVYLAVRRDPNGATGWMRLSRWEVLPHSEDPVRFSGGTAPPWSAFTEQWRAIYEACRAGQYIDCDGTATNIAQGGELQMMLWTREQGMKVTFMQVNAPDAGVPAPGGGPELIDGVRRPARGEEEEEQGPPATEASFTFRQQEAVDAESAISAISRPVCSTQACQLVVQTDATAPSMRVISLLGAVYENGFQEPQVAFRLTEGQE
jgi:biopolymer transport protein ExbD